MNEHHHFDKVHSDWHVVIPRQRTAACSADFDHPTLFSAPPLHPRCLASSKQFSNFLPMSLSNLFELNLTVARKQYAQAFIEGPCRYPSTCAMIPQDDRGQTP